MTKEMTTYRRVDGEGIWGEFGWVTDLEFFEDCDEPLKVLEEVWELRSTRTFWVGNKCPVCHETVDDYDGSDIVVHEQCRAEWEDENGH